MYLVLGILLTVVFFVIAHILKIQKVKNNWSKAKYEKSLWLSAICILALGVLLIVIFTCFGVGRFVIVNV